MDGTGKERDPWQRTNYLLCKGLNDGELYTFTTSSKGGLDAVARLCKDYVPFLAQRPNDWPVIEIGTDSYAHPNKDFGRIKVPTFKIVGFEPKAVFAPDLGEQHQVVMDDDADVDEFPEEVAERLRPSRRRSRRPSATGSKEKPAAGLRPRRRVTPFEARQSKGHNNDANSER